MGWTDEEIDHLYKKASNHQSVGYSDAYWKEMEAMLDAEKPARKRFFVWWFFGAALIVVAIGLSYYLVATSGTAPQAKTPVAQTNRVPATDVSETERINQIPDNRINATTSDVSGTTTTQSGFQPVKTAETSMISASGKTHRFTQKERRIIEKEEKTAVGVTAIQPEQTNRELHEFTRVNPEQPLTAPENEHPEQQEATVSPEDVAELQEKEQQITPSVGEATIAQAVDVDELLLKKKTGFYVGADAGAGTSYLRQPTNLYIQWGVKAGVDYTIRNRFRLGGGFGFRQQMLNDLTVSWSREYYSLGLINVNQSITYDRLQFVDFNIHAHYVFRKFAVGLDVSPSYLISARAKMDQTQEENGKPVDGSMTHTTEKQYVRSDNFNAFGLDAGVSFQYQFKHQMLLELGVGARVNKLLMNTNFNGERNKLPLRLELGFVKRF